MEKNGTSRNGQLYPRAEAELCFPVFLFFFAFLFFPFPTWTAGTRQSAPANPYKWAVKLKLWPLSVQKSCDTTQECWFLVWINAFQIQSRFRRRGKCCQIKRIKVGFVKGLWLGAHCAKPERVLRKSVLKKMAQKNHRRFKLLILKENTWNLQSQGLLWWGSRSSWADPALLPARIWDLDIPSSKIPARVPPSGCQILSW